MQVRKAKRQALIDKGVSPYPVELPITTTIAEIREKFEGLEAGVELTTLSNYQDLRKQISMYFDNELCSDDKQQLLQRVDVDPKCSSLFRKEKNFREYIKSNIKRPNVSNNLIDNIKNKMNHTV